MTSHRPDDIICFEVGSSDVAPWIGARGELEDDWTSLQLQQRRGVIQIDLVDDRVLIRGATRVGLVVLPSGRRLIVRSKVSGLVLLDWLAYVGEFPRLSTWLSEAGVTTGSDWPECIAKLFLFAMEQVTRRQMRKEYVTVRASESAIRGKILVSSLAKTVHQLPRIPQLQRRRTCDTPLNVVLAQALDRLPLLLSHRPDAMRRIAHLREQWAAVDRNSHDAKAAVMAAQHVCPPGYRDALQLARLILVGAALDSQANTGGQAFTLSLASVWERALKRMLDDLSGESGWRRMSKELCKRHWDDPAGRKDPKRWMTADVILERQGERWILDAKYKSEFGDESRVDRFQICAYAVAFDGGHASLVYPSKLNGDPVRRLLLTTINGRTIQIDSIGLPMFAGPESCREVLSSVIRAP